MSYMYGILSVVGWIWAAMVGAYLIARARNSGHRGRGFDVLDPHEKQS